MMALPLAPHAWRLGDLLDGLIPAGVLSGRTADTSVCALARDSHRTVPGALFLACRGERGHGLAQATDAARRGATAILAEPSREWPREALAPIAARTGLPVLALENLDAHIGRLADRFFGQPSASMQVVAVVGGKSADNLSHFLAQALSRELRCATLSSLGTGFTGELSLDSGRLDRDPLVLHSVLADLGQRGAAALTLATDNPDALVASGLRIGQAIVCGASLAADATGLAERWARSLADLDPDVVAVDCGCPELQSLPDRLPSGMRVVGYSLSPDWTPHERCSCWVRAAAARPTPTGLDIRVETSHGNGQLRVPTIGSANAGPALAALALLLARGAEPMDAMRDLGVLGSVPGRMEAFGGKEAPLAVVDDGCSPDAIERALTDLRQHGHRRIIAVLGCAGGRDRGQRPLMGAIAERLADALILTDDNPGYECGETIVADILAGLANPDAVWVERRRGVAIRRAVALAGRGDAVLVAGKGRETTQDYGDLKVHFSDRAQIVEALREWREGHH
jgi:UDP-N-acetylmuramoyl-L-alanyl-D-glutamate--2,6-diaminopimelate ligase